MDGIRAAAPGTANRIVDTSRQKMSTALDHLDANLIDSQWRLAEVDRWRSTRERLQSMLASGLWLLKAVQVEPLPEDLTHTKREHITAPIRG